MFSVRRLSELPTRLAYFPFLVSLAAFVSIQERFWLCRRRRRLLGLRDFYFSSDVAKNWQLNFGVKLDRKPCHPFCERRL